MFFMAEWILLKRLLIKLRENKRGGVMKKNSPWKLILLFSFLLFLTVGCGGQPKAVTSPSTAEEKIGTIDLEQAVKAHPQWQEIEKIEGQIAVLKEQYRQGSTSPDPNQHQLQQQKIYKLHLQEQEREWKKEQEAASRALGQKIQSKKQELEKIFPEEVAELRQKKSKELEDYRKQLKVLYGTQIVNLQLKLEFANLSENERKQKKEELDQLTQEQQDKLVEKQKELEEEIRRDLQATQAALEKELKDYQAQEEALLQKKLAAQHQVFQQALQKERAAQDKKWQQFVAAEQKNSQQKLAARKKLEQKNKDLSEEKKQIEEQILGDLQRITAQIAQKEHLRAVIVNYRVNVLAVDLTFLVIEEAKRLK